MALQDWSTTASDNISVGSVNIAENCPAGNMNNAVREVMAQVKTFTDQLPGAYQFRRAMLTALGELALAADQIPYATGASTMGATGLTPFMRTLLDDADPAAACVTLGAVRVYAATIANPGFIRFQVGPTSFVQIAWGTLTCAAESSTSVAYAASFPNASFPVCSGSDGNTSGTRNTPSVVGGAANKNGFVALNASAGSVSAYYIAVGY